MKTSGLLQKVRDLLARPGAWIQGRMVVSNNVEACGWCLMGAMYRVAGDSERNYQQMELAVKLAIPGNDNIIAFNDDRDRTQLEVLLVLDAAIAAEQQKEGSLCSP